LGASFARRGEDKKVESGRNIAVMAILRVYPNCGHAVIETIKVTTNTSRPDRGKGIERDSARFYLEGGEVPINHTDILIPGKARRL
jgi:hypothetical protein